MHAPEYSVVDTSADAYRIRVLVVDDQAMIGEAIRRIVVHQPDMEFHYCGNPAAAVETAEKFRPTVVLQDLVMPGVDGLELLRHYRDNPMTKDVPIVVLSTKEEPAVKSEAFALGASDYLIKLPDPIELVARIRHHSKAYLHHLQRDAAYDALRQSQRQLLETNNELQRLVNVDGLTGLSNRRYFNEYIETQLKLSVRELTPLSVLMIDVDDFKRYNDTHGHLAGDEVLKSIATATKKSFQRPLDLAARFGGEEFVVILPTTPQTALQSLGERLRHNVEDLYIAHDAAAGRHVTVSVGGATLVPRRQDSVLGLIESADKALYTAKRTGKNRVVTSLEGCS